MAKRILSMTLYRKKQAAFVVLVIALVSFLMLSIPSVFSAVQNSEFMAAMEEYGEFHCIYYDLEEKHFTQLENTAVVKEIGRIENYGNYPLADGQADITLGKFDETALRLSRIKLEEGRWPEAEGEIAVEKHVLYQLPKGAQIGTTLAVETPTGEVCYTICGIVKDYRAKWSVPDSIQEGMNDLPSGFVYDGQGLPSAPVYSAMMYFHTLKKTEEPFILEAQIFDSLGIEGSFQFKDNANLYQHVLGDKLRMTIWYEKYFVLLTLIGAGVILFIVLFGYYRNFREMSYTLYTLGAARREILGLLLGNGLLLGVLGSALGFGASAIFSAFMQKWTGEAPELLQRSWSLGVVVLAVLGIAVVYEVLKLRGLYGLNYSERAQSRQRKRKREENVEEIGKFLPPVLAVRHVGQNWKRLVGLFLVAAVLVCMVFCIRWENKQRVAGWVREVPTLSSMAATGWACANYGSYELSGLYKFFNADQIDEIRELPGVLEVYKGYSTSASLVVPYGEDIYWDIFIQNNPTTDWWGRGEEIATIPQDQRATQFGYGFVVLDREEQEWLKAAYPELDVDALLADGQAIVFCPPIDTLWRIDEEEIYFGEDFFLEIPGGIVYNESLKAGDTLTFGWLESELPLREAVEEHPEEIYYREETLPISALINEGFYMERNYSIDDEWDGLTIILSRETAEEAGYIQGIFNFSVRMDPEISDADYAAVEEAFGRVAYTISGSNNYSSREEEARIQKTQRVVRATFAILAGVLGGFICLSLISTLYGTLLQRQQMFGILRATGFRKGQMFWMIMLELLVYWMILSLFTYIVSLWGGYQFSVNQVGVYMNPEDLWQMAGQIALVCLGTLGIFMLIAGLVTHRIWKQSISTAIRFEE